MLKEAISFTTTCYLHPSAKAVENIWNLYLQNIQSFVEVRLPVNIKVHSLVIALKTINLSREVVGTVCGNSTTPYTSNFCKLFRCTFSLWWLKHCDAIKFTTQQHCKSFSLRDFAYDIACYCHHLSNGTHIPESFLWYWLLYTAFIF